MLLSGCCKSTETQETRVSFEDSLAAKDYATAYTWMCPEYQSAQSETQFTAAIKASPYLATARDATCFGRGRGASYGTIVDLDCVVDTEKGVVPVRVHTRSSPSCVIAVEVAGAPVVHLHAAGAAASSAP